MPERGVELNRLRIAALVVASVWYCASLGR